MQGMRFKFRLVDSISVENQLARFLVGGIHSLSDGAEVCVGVGLNVDDVCRGQIGSGQGAFACLVTGLVQCLLWLKRCQLRSVYTYSVQ